MNWVTVDCENVGDLEAKGSRFYAYLVPISHFETRLDALGIEHRKASHIVTATRVIDADNSIAERARDDGEPGGTAGMPVLKVMIGSGLVDAGIAVVRYFGGVKLGTGGLARAYGGAAAQAVKTATFRPWARTGTSTLHCPFERTSVLQATVDALELTVLSREHTATGTVLTVEGPEAALADAALAEWRR